MGIGPGGPLTVLAVAALLIALPTTPRAAASGSADASRPLGESGWSFGLASLPSFTPPSADLSVDPSGGAVLAQEILLPKPYSPLIGPDLPLPVKLPGGEQRFPCVSLVPTVTPLLALDPVGTGDEGIGDKAAKKGATARLAQEDSVVVQVGDQLGLATLSASGRVRHTSFMGDAAHLAADPHVQVTVRRIGADNCSTNDVLPVRAIDLTTTVGFSGFQPFIDRTGSGPVTVDGGRRVSERLTGKELRGLGTATWTVGAQGKNTGLLGVGFGQVKAGGVPLPGVNLDAHATIDTGQEVYRLKVSPGAVFP